jgi:hypothetical protein
MALMPEQRNEMPGYVTAVHAPHNQSHAWLYAEI